MDSIPPNVHLRMHPAATQLKMEMHLQARSCTLDRHLKRRETSWTPARPTYSVQDVFSSEKYSTALREPRRPPCFHVLEYEYCTLGGASVV